MLLKDLFEADEEAMRKMRMLHRSNFNRRKLDVDFGDHANQRSIEVGRGDNVDPHAFFDALNKMLRMYDDKNPRLMAAFDIVARKGIEVEIVAIYKYGDTAINIPCVIKPGRKPGRFTVAIKTIMVKSNFKPHSTHDVVIPLNFELS